MNNVENLNCIDSLPVMSVWIEVMDMLRVCVSEFMQQDGRKKRTAKHLCVTNVTGLLLACFVEIFT